MVHLAPVSSVLVAQTTQSARAPAAIDADNASQRDYWAYRLSVSPHDLNAAIDAVGPSVAAIRRHLGK